MSFTPINNSFDNSHPLTSKIAPSWTNYKGLTTTQKTGKIISDIFKTLLCCSIIVPLVTLCIDPFIKKEPVAQIDKAPEDPTKTITPKQIEIVDSTKAPSDTSKSTKDAGIQTDVDPLIRTFRLISAAIGIALIAQGILNYTETNFNSSSLGGLLFTAIDVTVGTMHVLISCIP